MYAMTPEQLKEAEAKEAQRLAEERCVHSGVGSGGRTVECGLVPEHGVDRSVREMLGPSLHVGVLHVHVLGRRDWWAYHCVNSLDCNHRKKKEEEEMKKKLSQEEQEVRGWNPSCIII